jgi:hypothetical protein
MESATRGTLSVQFLLVMMVAVVSANPSCAILFIPAEGQSLCFEQMALSKRELGSQEGRRKWL